MDCQDALEVLEAVRAGSDDLKDSRFADAAAHLEVCAQCGVVFNSRQAFDRTVASAMREVPIPADLEQHLLKLAQSAETSLENSGKSAPDAVDEPAPLNGSTSGSTPQPAANSLRSTPEKPSRRMWFRIAAATSVCLLAATLFWLYPRSTEAKISLYAILHATPVDIADLPDFDNDFRVKLPGVAWQNEDIHIAQTARKFRISDSDRNMCALYAFHVFRRDHSRAEGVLLVIPRKRVEESDLLPEVFSSRNLEYVPKQSDEYVAIAWTKDDLVFVCFVPGDDEAIQALDVALYGSAPT